MKTFLVTGNFSTARSRIFYFFIFLGGGGSGDVCRKGSERE